MTPSHFLLVQLTVAVCHSVLFAFAALGFELRTSHLLSSALPRGPLHQLPQCVIRRLLGCIIHLMTHYVFLLNFLSICFLVFFEIGSCFIIWPGLDMVLLFVLPQIA
jgi:hypothetical protein